MTPKGLARLKLDEGLRLTAYRDTVGVWTIGYGCTGKGIGPGVAWSQDHAEVEFGQRVKAFEAALADDLPWFAALDPVRRDVLTNIAFNVGIEALEHWRTTLGHIRDGLYQSAARDLRTEGRWDEQVGDRAERLAHAMEAGEWA